MTFKDDLDFICKAIVDSYCEVKTTSNQAYDKTTYDEVTDLDLQIESKIIEKIKAENSGSILSEEFNSGTRLNGRVWIIDPIDGTCNMTHGIPSYGIQCALVVDNEIQLCAIYFPNTSELFTAMKGCGAFLNGERIHCKKRPVNRSIVSFGDFVHSDPHLLNLEHTIMQRVSGRVERVRMYGAASIDFSYAAMGRIDGNFTFVKNPWDVLPGVLLCREAGLIVVDVHGKPFESGKPLAVFSSEELMRACINE